jgi:hypothetical protein
MSVCLSDESPNNFFVDPFVDYSRFEVPLFREKSAFDDPKWVTRCHPHVGTMNIDHTHYYSFGLCGWCGILSSPSEPILLIVRMYENVVMETN